MRYVILEVPHSCGETMVFLAKELDKDSEYYTTIYVPIIYCNDFLPRGMVIEFDETEIILQNKTKHMHRIKIRKYTVIGGDM